MLQKELSPFRYRSYIAYVALPTLRQAGSVYVIPA